MNCNEKNCNEKAIALSLCQKHYMQHRRGTLGQEQQPRPSRKADRYTEAINVALTKAERTALETAAEARGHRTLSAFVRSVLAGAGLIPIVR